MGRSRPLHSFQGPLIHWSVCRDGFTWISAHRGVKNFRQGELAFTRASRCHQAAGASILQPVRLARGFRLALGFALGARLRGKKFHTFVVLGDGELQEGMVWEALHIAPRYKLGNLTAILDWNGLQQFGWVLAVNEQHRGDRRDPWGGVDLRGIFEKLGWRCIEINGHDFSQVVPALQSVKASGESDQPTMIIAHTVKGKGVHFTEGKHEWHSKVATKDELRIIAKELGIEEAIA